jgi:hypothetical protein
MKQSARELGNGQGRRGRAGAGGQGYEAIVARGCRWRGCSGFSTLVPRQSAAAAAWARCERC